jgi:hypothetical protein
VDALVAERQTQQANDERDREKLLEQLEVEEEEGHRLLVRDMIITIY